MRIEGVEAFPIRLRRDLGEATGTAGSPTRLGAGTGAYRWSSVYPALYSEYFETALVRVTLSDGTSGWGEAQAPLAPRVASTIVEDLLAPALLGMQFDGAIETIESLWRRMYDTMRVRGQTGGFMLDAISGVDLALWDLAGKLQEQPVAVLLAGEKARSSVPGYLSGLSGSGLKERVEFARRYRDRGFTLFKIFHDGGEEELLGTLDALRSGLGGSADLAVDALWRLHLPGSERLLRQLEARRLAWLECPFPPDEIAPHRELRLRFSLPLAVGESYRSERELEVFFEERLMRFVQPDLGRCGLTGTLRIARRAASLGVRVVPHVSIALGPQIAAAIHAVAAVSQCEFCEYNPKVLSVSNRYLAEPLTVDGACYRTPAAPGLGVEVRLEALLGETVGFRD